MKINKKGFTLVELLAVIVVLAIIMIIAIPNVMQSMQNARIGSFKVYAQRVMSKAEEQYQADLLFESANECYTLKGMGLENTGNYDGYVEVTSSDDGKTTFKVTLTDKNYSVSGFTYSQLDSLTEETISKATSITKPTGCKDS